jgi:hypothetical protein
LMKKCVCIFLMLLWSRKLGKSVLVCRILYIDALVSGAQP